MGRVKKRPRVEAEEEEDEDVIGVTQSVNLKEKTIRLFAQSGRTPEDVGEILHHFSTMQELQHKLWKNGRARAKLESQLHVSSTALDELLDKDFSH